MKIGYEDFVSYDVAKLLQENGFDWPTVPFYDIKKKEFCSRVGNVFQPCDWYHTYPERKFYSAPTHQMACEWLRQKHNLSVEVYRTACGWIGCVVAISSGTDIKFLEDDGDDPASGTYTSHFGAAEATIKYCLENLINKED